MESSVCHIQLIVSQVDELYGRKVVVFLWNYLFLLICRCRCHHLCLRVKEETKSHPSVKDSFLH